MVRAIAIGVVAILLSACGKPPTVLHQGDAVFDRSFQTYSVIYHPVGSDRNTRHIFESAVHGAMTAKGYAKASGVDADMIISFAALTTSESNDTGAGRDVHHMAELSGQSPEDVDKVVMVTIERRRTNQIVWIGWSAGGYAEQDVLPMTKKAVNGILALIPSRASTEPPTVGRHPRPAPDG